MNSPLVSVIIATYNRADLIAKAIESVLSQTLAEFELLIMDDGSTDGTAEVVGRYPDPRISYHPLEHGERSRARNQGLQRSCGKYVAFLDSDDWYLSNKLADQVRALEADSSAGLTLGGWRIEDNSGRLLAEMHPWEVTGLQPTMEEWLFSTTCTPITLLARKDWLDRAGGFDPQLTQAEDLELWMRLNLLGCKVIWTRQIVGTVLVHPTNSLKNWPQVQSGRLDFLAKIFSNPEFTSRLKLSREEVYAKFHLTLAWLAFDSGLAQAGRGELEQALELNPKLIQDQGQIIRTAILDYSSYFMVADPIRFVDLVFTDLPEQLDFLKTYRREVLAKAAMSLAWRAHRNKDISQERRGVRLAVWYDPGCLRDRGIQSMFVQTLIGQRIWAAAREAFGRQGAGR